MDILLITQGKNMKSLKLVISDPTKDTSTKQALIQAHLQATQTLKPVFIRDTQITGYCLKINPSGKIQNVCELSHQGKSYRRTLAPLFIRGFDNPSTAMTIEQARNESLHMIAEIRSNGEPSIFDFINTGLTLQMLLNQYLELDLTSKTKRDYRFTIEHYLQDWLSTQLPDISKQMIVNRFNEIMNNGFKGGRPTHSQASKTMRVLSALLNYAIGYEHLDNNPCEVLKLRRISKHNKRKDTFLTHSQAIVVMDKLQNTPRHQAIKFIFHTGVRKNECLSLQWTDIKMIDDLKYILIKNTKNKRDHIIPVTPVIQSILDTMMQHQKEQGVSSTIVFNDKGKKILDLRKTFIALTGDMNLNFTCGCHDLRRTFATHCNDIGIQRDTIKDLLNHKRNDVTDGYIQRLSYGNVSNLKKALERVIY
jgi:integrase